MSCLIGSSWCSIYPWRRRCGVNGHAHSSGLQSSGQDNAAHCCIDKENPIYKEKLGIIGDPATKLRQQRFEYAKRQISGCNIIVPQPHAHSLLRINSAAQTYSRKNNIFMHNTLAFHFVACYCSCILQFYGAPTPCAVNWIVCVDLVSSWPEDQTPVYTRP